MKITSSKQAAELIKDSSIKEGTQLYFTAGVYEITEIYHGSRTGEAAGEYAEVYSDINEETGEEVETLQEAQRFTLQDLIGGEVARI